MRRKIDTTAEKLFFTSVSLHIFEEWIDIAKLKVDKSQIFHFIVLKIERYKQG